jgi:hypothetical protein
MRSSEYSLGTLASSQVHISIQSRQLLGFHLNCFNGCCERYCLMFWLEGNRGLWLSCISLAILAIVSALCGFVHVESEKGQPEDFFGWNRNRTLSKCESRGRARVRSDRCGLNWEHSYLSCALRFNAVHHVHLTKLGLLFIYILEQHRCAVIITPLVTYNYKIKMFGLLPNEQFSVIKRVGARQHRVGIGI